ncbi:unnamed protein product, partial [Ilex paraguariensis]
RSKGKSVEWGASKWANGPGRCSIVVWRGDPRSATREEGCPGWYRGAIGTDYAIYWARQRGGEGGTPVLGEQTKKEVLSERLKKSSKLVVVLGEPATTLSAHADERDQVREEQIGCARDFGCAWTAGCTSQALGAVNQVLGTTSKALGTEARTAQSLGVVVEAGEMLLASTFNNDIPGADELVPSSGTLQSQIP